MKVLYALIYGLLLLYALFVMQCRPQNVIPEQGEIQIAKITPKSYEGKNWICQTGSDSAFPVEGGWGKVYFCEFDGRVFGDFMLRIHPISRRSVNVQPRKYSPDGRVLVEVAMEGCDVWNAPTNQIRGDYGSEPVRAMFHAWFEAVVARATTAGCGKQLQEKH